MWSLGSLECHEMGGCEGWYSVINSGVIRTFKRSIITTLRGED